jgi:hypothetical protein
MTTIYRSAYAAVLLLCSGAVLALPVGTNITIYDGDSSAPTGWAGMQEDNETEPGTVQDQSWDLENFFSYGTNQLGMVGGYNFFNNLGGDYRPGDIFIDINGGIIAGNATGSDGNTNVANTFGYEYALDIDWANLTYNVMQLDPGTVTTTTYYGINYGSSPWAYVSGGSLIGSGSFTGESGLTDGDTGMLGGSHYAAYGFDLSFLGVSNYTAHFTAACGNDNLMGSATTVPVPAAVWLFGSAIGLLGYGARRRQRKQA